MHRLLEALTADLAAWAPQLKAEEWLSLARRLILQLESRAGRAEHRLADGTSLSWLFDQRSGQLLSTYPDGAVRIRIVANPGRGCP
ncbi:MAG: hypothetical protein ACOY93_17825 [Bacillota bacterium]